VRGSQSRIPHVAPRRGPITKEAWRSYVAAKPSVPPEVPAGRLTEEKRTAFDAARVRHHSAFGPVFTAPMRRIHRELWAQLEANVEAPTPRPGAVIDGQANLGKSTILTSFGRHYELDQQKALDDAAAREDFNDFVPVVYVTLPANANVKDLNRRIVRFYGRPFARGASTGELTVAIQDCAAGCGTTLFLVDDLHFLELGRRTHRDVNDHLKDLASTVGATFVLAGIGVEKAGMLSEGYRADDLANSQFQGRYALHSVGPFGYRTREEQQRWVKLLRSVEQQLVLLKAPPDVLSGPLAEYLYARTHGYIGSLSSLLRKAANEALRDGSETITRKLLDSIKVNHYAQQLSAKAPTKQRARRPEKSPS
jgi:Bacterial TniB protein